MIDQVARIWIKCNELAGKLNC